MKRRKTETLADGQRFRVPMQMMDAVQRDVARSGRINAVDLRFGDDNGLRRPGFRLPASTFRPDLAVRDAAYADYDAALTDAWRNPDTVDAGRAAANEPDEDEDEDDGNGTERETSDNRGSRRMTSRDPAGRETGTFNEEDTRRVAQVHATKMDGLYADHDRRLSQAWRGR